MDKRPRLTALKSAHKGRFTLHSGDILDLGSLVGILNRIQVDEVYHLAGQSHVALSFEQPLYTYNTNALGTARVLEALASLDAEKPIRFYNVGASSKHLAHPAT